MRFNVALSEIFNNHPFELIAPFFGFIGTAIVLIFGGYDNTIRFNLYSGKKIETTIISKSFDPRWHAYTLKLKAKYKSQQIDVERKYLKRYKSTDIEIGVCKIFFDTPRLFGCENTEVSYYDTLAALLFLIFWTTIALLFLGYTVLDVKGCNIVTENKNSRLVRPVIVLSVVYYLSVLIIVLLRSTLIP